MGASQQRTTNMKMHSYSSYTRRVVMSEACVLPFNANGELRGHSRIRLYSERTDSLVCGWYVCFATTQYEWKKLWQHWTVP